MKHQVPSQKDQMNAVKEYAERVYDGLPDYPTRYMVCQNTWIRSYVLQAEALASMSGSECLYKVSRADGATTIAYIQ